LIGGSRLLAFWYHFAIMFEALFILTVLDTGTRVGRFMLQELLGRVWEPAGRTGWWPSAYGCSVLMVGAWGYFLYRGVVDPLGGINTLWPLFGIANQLLATVALVVATTIIIKMGRLRWMWVTLAPMAWLITVTMTAAYQKIFHASPRIGFLSYANHLAGQIASGAIAPEQVAATERLIFNNRVDAVVAGVFAVLVLLLFFEAFWEWFRILSGRKKPVLHEAPYVATRWAEGD
jgi:carbon starvation protein